LRRTAAALLALSPILGCAPPERPPEVLPAPAGPEGGAQTGADARDASAGDAKPSDSGQPSESMADGSPAEGMNDTPFAGTVFPPATVVAPHERSAQPGDGEWQRLGHSERGETLAGDPAAMFKTVIHPHPVSKWVTLTVAAIDLCHVSVQYVPGTADVKDTKTDPEQLPVTPGHVPEQDRDALLAVFNGGFKPHHGGWGMLVRSVQVVPPREDGCTVAITTDGAVRIGSWPNVAGALEDVRSYRQTPPCLLEQGALHPSLRAYNERPWGGRDPKRKTRRRSAIGIDASGRILFYGVGEEAGPRDIANGMKAAGAISAAQLDINWSWTRFLLFGRPRPDAELEVTSTLIPQMVHRRKGYVVRSVARDFFYVTRRGR
jgi:hypothetical protein